MQSFNLDITATTTDGIEVPVKITVEYPDNQGLIAYQALQQAAEKGSQIIAVLASMGDLGLLAAMEKSGIVLDDFDDEDSTDD